MAIGKTNDLYTAAELSTNNPYLERNHIFVERDTGLMKIGPGHWNSLGYPNVAETAATMGATINGAGAAVPNDTDLVATAASSVLKKITWTNVKAFLKTYFDTLYQPLSADLTAIVTAFVPASASSSASLAFLEDTDNGAHAVTLKAPAAVTANVDVTLPDAAGTVALTSQLAPFTAASASGAAALAFAEDTDNGVHAVTLKAPAAVTANVDVTLPDAAGTLALAGGATNTEIDQIADVSAYQETVIAAGALSVTKLVSKLEVASGGAVTLAVPDASMYGKIKTIEMSVDDGDVTFALTNVVGQSSGTTATFNSPGDLLVLLAAFDKWVVLKEVGVALS